jgi:hypothetical protein
MVGVSTVPFEYAVACNPAVTGFPAVTDFLAVDSVLAVTSVPTDPGVPILAGGFTYWIYNETYYTIGLSLKGGFFGFICVCTLFNTALSAAPQIPL